MTKKEIIWREILVQASEQKKNLFTQKELAGVLGVSLSTVFNALKIPRQAHMIDVSGRNFRLDSYHKLLLLWASHRVLQKDMLYTTRVDIASKAIEALFPPSAQFGFYSAFAFSYQETPADYDHVYVYGDSLMLPEIRNRFSIGDEKSKNPNVFLLKKDSRIAQLGHMPPEQIFVDIWNAPEWYAKDFLKSLEDKLSLHA